MRSPAEEHEHRPKAASDPQDNEPPHAHIQNRRHEFHQDEGQEHRGARSKFGVENSEPSGARIKVLPK